MIAETLAAPAAQVALGLAAVAAAVMTSVVLRAVAAPRVGTPTDDDLIRRVFRNSAIPIVSQLMVRVVDLGVAIVLLRLLGPEGNGRYAVAVVVWLYVKTVSDFGLSLLVTRDIARDRTLTGVLVGATTLLRLAILGLAIAPVSLYVAIGVANDSLAWESALAIAILFLSIVPSSYSEAANSALNGHERMDVAAWINVGVSGARAPLVVALGATTLGVVGVALAAFIAATLSAGLFGRALTLVTGHRVVWRLPRNLAYGLARDSWPLLVNALLINLFFRVDVFIVQAHRGDAALGVYDASYKVINLVTILPAYVTLAIFPTMAVRANDPVALERAQRTATYLLVWLAWGIVAVGSAGARIAIWVLAGEEYLPEAATLLRVLIWFAPLSFLNGVIQYVLVAVGEQRRIVPAFVAAVAFNLGANLALVPEHGARAAAAVTVTTEAIILLAFVLVTRHTVVKALTTSTAARLARPTLAGLAAFSAALPFDRRNNEAAAVAIAIVVFAAATLALQVFGPDERAIVRRALGRRSPSTP